MSEASERAHANRLLLTGAPGVGKTTVVCAVARALPGLGLSGFFTEEIRAGRDREGFALVTFDGRRALMAHANRPGSPRVGKYGVDVGVIDAMARSVLVPREETGLYLVDEIGRMECLSPEFVSAMHTLLDASLPIVATIGRGGGGFMDEVRRRRDVTLWEITRANRDDMPARVRTWIERHAERARPGRA